MALGRNPLPQRRRGSRIGGNGSYKPPGAPYILQDPEKKKQMLYNQFVVHKNVKE